MLESGERGFAMPRMVSYEEGTVSSLEQLLTESGRWKRTHPKGPPIQDKRITWTVVCRARRVMGKSRPLRADFEMRVTEMAHEEWNSTVRTTFKREATDGGGDDI